MATHSPAVCRLEHYCEVTSRYVVGALCGTDVYEDEIAKHGYLPTCEDCRSALLRAAGKGEG